ncbi:FMN-binding negative transcriptional regulator [Erythrobacter mangrovi]|uniref:FMN-binding negative transcriptional regulator n=1 Tax=Erythrobacter mangrovi TaxID=2739433 RepID=A0A7D3XG54_9SPHN|nr:FMN-binding negative transcriptional regulator [Erythrobacter mangrovi]QKG70213.1 FMN-binding negative transcriptional regulator [Erythrobacter mangrovi]
MHPNPAFRHDDRQLFETLIAEIGFGMVFCTTPDGPRVAHVPLHSTGDGAVQFHLARGNALTKHLEGQTALAVVNGPDGYVSARWYADQKRVPTWNYVALELEGRVRRMDGDGLLAQVEAVTAREEARVLGGKPWTMDKLPDSHRRGLLAAIVGFELEISAWRPTFKLSQNAPAEERERVIAGLELQGARAIADLMRKLVP